MRRLLISTAFLALVVALPMLVAQEKQIIPAVAIKPVAEPSAGNRDLTKLSPKERHFYLSAKGGMEWLQRLNRADGRFLPGFIPALRVPLEGQSLIHQADAAGALARAAAYFRDDRATAVAKQALLTLLLETTLDAKTQIRTPAAPEAFVNHLAGTSALALAIHELANPAQDLVQNADQLVNYLRSQQQADGSFKINAEDAKFRTELTQTCTGPALNAIIRSNTRQPVAWKADAVRRACAYFHAWWRQNKNVPMIADHSAAYAAAYQATKDKAFADCIFEMNDWLCGLQYTSADPRQPHWMGSFQPWIDGKAVPLAPDISSAAAAYSLANACLAARMAGDAARLERYRSALENCLLFVTSLQYTEANTPHFADWYRQNFLLGGFHLSHQDGNVRIEYAQHAVLALVQHLQQAE